MRIKEKAKEVIMEKVSMGIKDIMIKKVAEMSIKEEKNSDDEVTDSPRSLDDIELVSRPLELKKLTYEVREADRVRDQEEMALNEYMDQIEKL